MAMARSPARRTGECWECNQPLRSWRLLMRPHLKRQSQSKLKGSRIAYRGRLSKGCRRIAWIHPGAEHSVRYLVIAVVECVENLGYGFQPPALGKRERPAETCAHREEVKAVSGVACDEGSIRQRWTGAGALNRIRARGDVERQRRIVLQDAAQLKSVGNVLPGRIGLTGWRVDRAIENQPVPLVVIGPSVVTPNIEIVDWRAEE